MGIYAVMGSWAVEIYYFLRKKLKRFAHNLTKYENKTFLE